MPWGLRVGSVLKGNPESVGSAEVAYGLASQVSQEAFSGEC